MLLLALKLDFELLLNDEADEVANIQLANW